MDFEHVWEGPTSLVGVLVQIVFISSLLGAIPAALVGILIKLRSHLHRGSFSRGWLRAFRAAVAFQACGVIASALLLWLFWADGMLWHVGVFTAVVVLNFAVGTVGLVCWASVTWSHTTSPPSARSSSLVDFTR